MPERDGGKILSLHAAATLRNIITQRKTAKLYRFLHKGRNLNDVPFGRRDAGASRRSAGKMKGPKSDVRSIGHELCVIAMLLYVWGLACP